TGGRDGEFLHDLVSAAVVAPLPPDEISKLVDGLDGPAIEPAYRRLAAGQLAEIGNDLDAALAHYVAAADASTLLPAPRGTAHVGAARTLLARGQVEAAAEHVRRAEEFLARWSGWRVAELDAVRRRLVPEDTPAAAGVVLTPREREVAQLVA